MTKIEKKKRCYLASCNNCEYVVAFIAHSVKEAKKMAVGNEFFEWCDNPILCTNVKWQKHVDASTYQVGELDAEEGLKIGVYSYLREWPCDVCKNYSDCTYEQGKIVCENCLLELTHPQNED